MKNRAPDRVLRSSRSTSRGRSGIVMFPQATSPRLRVSHRSSSFAATTSGPGYETRLELPPTRMKFLRPSTSIAPWSHAVRSSFPCAWTTTLFTIGSTREPGFSRFANSRGPRFR